eukprot:scaffold4865_cov83-Cyclotella_meneghiniana.AAC.1
MAVQAIRPAPWTCGNPNDSALDPLTNQKPMFAFVHVYKTAGSTVRTFLRAYAHICRKGWMCLIGCTKVKPSSIQQIGEGSYWNPCKVKERIDRDQSNEGVFRHVHVSNIVLKDNIDILGGHFRIGTGDYILQKSLDNNVSPVRHIIFLRNSMERFVSGILYERRQEGETLGEIVDLIKKRVRGSRAADDYWRKSLMYLLTPMQAEEFESRKSEFIETNSSFNISAKEQFVKDEAMTAIHNLMKYNAIIGMSERMPQSLEILKHVLMTDCTEEQHSKLDFLANATKNVSHLTTSSVLAELKKDVNFMSAFEEYVKYETMVNDYAMAMHLKQYEQVTKANFYASQKVL